MTRHVKHSYFFAVASYTPLRPYASTDACAMDRFSFYNPVDPHAVIVSG